MEPCFHKWVSVYFVLVHTREDAGDAMHTPPNVFTLFLGSTGGCNAPGIAAMRHQTVVRCEISDEFMNMLFSAQVRTVLVISQRRFDGDGMCSHGPIMIEKQLL